MADGSQRVALLLVMRYPKWAAFFGILSMAVFRLPLSMNRKVLFWRLMGSGRNGSFDPSPDWQQWTAMVIFDRSISKQSLKTTSLNSLILNLLGHFIAGWISVFRVSAHAIMIEPREGHGSWSGQEPFGRLDRNGATWPGPIGVLTRATIRITRARRFWQHVDEVSTQMAKAEGFITSYGIGEMPLIKQATFSIWKSKAEMMAFAYKLPTHKEVIQKTNAERWYSEEMFVRFSLLKAWNLPQVEELIAASMNAGH